MDKLTILLLFCANVASAQPNIEWSHAFGGTGADQALALQNTDDGGFIVAGTSPSYNGDVFGNHGGLDFWVLKLDQNGTVQWKKCYGGSTDEQAYAVIQTRDGGYVLTGYTLSDDEDVSGQHGFYDAWVLRVDQSGVILWQKCLGGSGWDAFNAVTQAPDGGFVFAGQSRSTDGDVTGNHGGLDYWVVKLDSLGNLEWQRSHGGSHIDIAYSIVSTVDGGYFVGGECFSNDGNVTGNHGESDYWVLKLNFEGKIEWQKSFGGNSLEEVSGLLQSSDGGFILFGDSYSKNGDVTGNHGDNDFWLVKLDSLGNLDWQKSYGGSNPEYAFAICQTSDGGYVMTGQTQSNDGDAVGNDGGADLWVVKVDSLGELLWQKSLGGTQDEMGYAIQQAADGGYIAAGHARSNNGDVSGVHGSLDFWVVKLVPETSPSSAPGTNILNIFPNPAQQTIALHGLTDNDTWQLRIADIAGRFVMEQKLAGSSTSFLNLDVSALVTGLYLVTITADSGEMFTGKFWKG